MKFGKQLETSRVEDWKAFYIDFSFLKRALKDDAFTGASFLEMLEQELAKIDFFYSTQERYLLQKVKKIKASKEKSANKALLIECYHSLEKLKAFIHLNFHGFRKIVKKQVRRRPAPETGDFMNAVRAARFASSGALLEMYADLEGLYAELQSCSPAQAKEELVKRVQKDGSGFWKKLKRMLAPVKDPMVVQIWSEESAVSE